MSANEIQQLDRSIKQSQKLVDLGDALDRLRNNRDFKKVIVEGYFEQEAVRLVHALSDRNMQSSESQDSIQKQMIGIGVFSDYLHTLSTQANMARRSVEADEATRAELILEGA